MESSINFSVSSTSPAGIKTLWEAKYADTCLKVALSVMNFQGSAKQAF